jgi:hypothetical protein
LSALPKLNQGEATVGRSRHGRQQDCQPTQPMRFVWFLTTKVLPITDPFRLNTGEAYYLIEAYDALNLCGEGHFPTIGD